MNFLEALMHKQVSAFTRCITSPLLVFYSLDSNLNYTLIPLCIAGLPINADFMHYDDMATARKPTGLKIDV